MSRISLRLRRAALAFAVIAGAATVLGRPAYTDFNFEPFKEQVDTALVVSVDVSNSVDQTRYRLQMEGIAKALEDDSVIEAITGGPNGGILFSMVTWADRPNFVIPWTTLRSRKDAEALAQRVRTLPHQGGEFTCMTRMLRTVNDKIVPQIPLRALRVVVDVSGDGPDNCNAKEPIEAVRDELVSQGVTINGLPILEGAGTLAGPASTAQPKFPTSGGLDLKEWFNTKVRGGSGSFIMPAEGYKDFGRAIRQKFVVEISAIASPTKFARKQTSPPTSRVTVH